MACVAATGGTADAADTEPDSGVGSTERAALVADTLGVLVWLVARDDAALVAFFVVVADGFGVGL